MKNNYRKLKLSMLFQTILIFMLTVLVGGFILVVFVDGLFNDSITRGIVKFFESLSLDESSAVQLYWKLIGNNKSLFLIVGFILLFFLLLYIALSKVTRYLEQVSNGIENIINEDSAPVELIEELEPLAMKMNAIKSTIEKQKQEAAESERRKNDLVVFLAHDLKTPLTSIIAYLSVLEAEPDMPVGERAKYTHISLEKAVRLGELINEFFEITRYNLQDIILEKEPLDLSMMLEQLADEFYAVLKENRLTCTVETDERLMINGDPDKLARVFDNLLRNAISYSRPDTDIAIRAQALSGQVEIIFENKGSRIPEQKLQTIFEKFYRVDSARSSQTGGAGLGLAIAKQITTLHGGDIVAYSDERSNRFVVRLPLAKEEGEE